MSGKNSPDKKKDRKKKDKEEERLKQEELKLEQEKAEAKERLKILDNSGILDAYEYFLRSVCKNGLPDANIFEFAAQQILKYQKKMKQNQQKKQELNSYNKAAMSSPNKNKSPNPRDDRKESVQKIKPTLLPFKGEAKEQILKGLHKDKSPAASQKKR